MDHYAANIVSHVYERMIYNNIIFDVVTVQIVDRCSLTPFNVIYDGDSPHPGTGNRRYNCCYLIRSSKQPCHIDGWGVPLIE